MTIACVSASASNIGISSAYDEPMIASPPMLTVVLWPKPAAVSEFDISVAIPPLRDITPIWPGRYACFVFSAGPPMPPIFDLPGEMIPRQFGPISRAPFIDASSTICATSARGTRSVTITSSLIPFSSASNAASRTNAGGTVSTEPSTRSRCRDLAHGVVHGHAVDVAPAAPGVTPPTIFEP